MNLYIFIRVPRKEQGFPDFDKAVVLEDFRHENQPIDRLKHWCEQYPHELIYLTKPLEYAIGFTEFKVTRTLVT